MGTLYYGDNLDILTRYIADESVDLVYLDPPFNSAQNYNAFFQEKDGTAAAAQIAPPSPAAVSASLRLRPSRTRGSGTTTAAPPTTNSPCAPTSSAASCAPSWNSSGQTT